MEEKCTESLKKFIKIQFSIASSSARDVTWFSHHLHHSYPLSLYFPLLLSSSVLPESTALWHSHCRSDDCYFQDSQKCQHLSCELYNIHTDICIWMGRRVSVFQGYRNHVDTVGKFGAIWWFNTCISGHLVDKWLKNWLEKINCCLLALVDFTLQLHLQREKEMRTWSHMNWHMTRIRQFVTWLTDHLW